MDENEHRRWLADLAATDRAARAQAEPELTRGEAELGRERAKLARIQTSNTALEAALEAERHPVQTRDPDCDHAAADDVSAG